MSFELHELIGDTESILWWQMSIRAVLIFFAALILVRIGSTRIYGKSGSLDIVIAVILGSILSRALTGNAPFIATLAAALTLVVVHLVLARLSQLSPTLGHTIKGMEIQLVEDGHILHHNLKKARMTEHDLEVALRTQGSVDSLEKVKSAYLERNGEVSVVK